MKNMWNRSYNHPDHDLPPFYDTANYIRYEAGDAGVANLRIRSLARVEVVAVRAESRASTAVSLSKRNAATFINTLFSAYIHIVSAI